MPNHLMEKSRWFPHVTVAAVIENNNKFLMVRENKETPVINQPAGHLEANESLIAAVKREVIEETAHSFEPDFLVGIYRWTSKAKQTYVRFCFAGSVSKPLNQSLDPDILEATWLNIATMQNENLRSPLVMQCINDYRMGKRYELSMLNEV